MIILPEILPPCATSRAAAAARQADLTKPPGSLGRLESLATDLAGMQGRARPRMERIQVQVYAGDHGVCAQGVSPCKVEVTAQQTSNFAQGGGAVAVLAKLMGASLSVIDVGVDADLPDRPLLVRAKVRCGTRDFSQGPAMTNEECAQALSVGMAQVRGAGPLDALVVGEMGIGNTTASAALMAAYLDLDPLLCCGRGAGLDDDGVRHKAAVVSCALAVNRSGLADPFSTLAALGGLEIAAMTGAMLQAASQRIPVVVDGFIATAAALAGTRLAPNLRGYLVFGHRGAENGHRLLLERFQAQPLLLELGLRLGEGTGAELALPLLKAACHLLDELTTWDEAGVRRQGT